MTLQSALADLLARPAALPGETMARHPEFEVAIRRSQLMRVRIMLGIFPVFLCVIVFRYLWTRQEEGFLQMLALIVCVATYEALVYVLARRADRRDESLPLRFWQLNAALEALIPTLSILLIAHAGVIPGYRAVVLPLLLAYPLFIILSILSLRPSLAIISGVVSSVGYLGVVMHSRLAFDAPVDDPLPMNVLSLTPVYFLVLGGIAAAVSARIRGHVLAELHETVKRESAEHELFVAGKIQGGLLPTVEPELQDFRLAGWSRPAVQAGGDYYDWQTLPDGRVALVLADVSGHGLGPAVMAVLCRSYLRAALLQQDTLPQALAMVNTLVRDDLPDGWFITVAVAVLHPQDGRLELLSAGHGPILHYTASNGSVEMLPADAPPLGIVADLKLTTAREIHLAPGDMLALISDGFHEWPTPTRDRFGLERLRQHLASHAASEPRELIASLLATVEAFAQGTPQPDDLTAVVLKRNV